MAALVFSAISNRIGRRSELIVSQLGTCVGLIVLPSRLILGVVFLARPIDSLTAGSMATATTLAIDRSAPGARRQDIGVISARIGVGTMVGPAIVGAYAPAIAGHPNLRCGHHFGGECHCK